MKLSPEDKAERERQRLLDKAREYSAGTYCRKFVAPLFQRMIRAEAGAKPYGFEIVVVNGELNSRFRNVGECVCVTCGKVDSWDSGIKGMHTGHFLASRRNSILLCEANVSPQCSSCNFYRSGAPAEFRLWMEAVRGVDTIELLQDLKRISVSWALDELVDKRIDFSRRLKAAELKMKGI